MLKTYRVSSSKVREFGDFIEGSLEGLGVLQIRGVQKS